jgi:hypothetical protein
MIGSDSRLLIAPMRSCFAISGTRPRYIMCSGDVNFFASALCPY